MLTRIGMQLINTGKYVLKFYFSDPGACPAWVSNSYAYIDKLPDEHRQSLIDIHFKNNGADIPLAFINLAKLGFVALEKRFQNSDQSLKLETLDEEFVILKQKIDTFVKENNFGPEKVEFYHRELEILEQQLNVFSKKFKDSKSFFSRKKDKEEKPEKKPETNPNSKKSKSRTYFLIFLLLLTSIIIFNEPITTFVWKIFIGSKIENISTELKVSNYAVDGRRLTLYISETELKSKKYSELKNILQVMMDKAFAQGFENFVIRSLDEQVIAKNILVNKKPSLYLFYTPKP